METPAGDRGPTGGRARDPEGHGTPGAPAARGEGRAGLSTAATFGAAALSAIAAIGLVYLGFVQTEAGQRLENLALAGASLRAPGEVEGSLTSLSRISVLSFGGAIAVLGLVAIARRRWGLAFATAAVMAVSVVSAEILQAVLARPDLSEAPAWLLGNSFPSGHATIAVSIGIGALLVAPERLRWLVLPVAAAYAAIIAQAVQIAGWHRLSGTLGGALLVVAVACVVLAILAARGRVAPSREGYIHPRIRRAMLVTVAAAVGCGAVVALLPLAFPLLGAPEGAAGAFAHTALDLLGVGLTVLIVVLFAILIEPYSLVPDDAQAGDRHADVPAPGAG